MQSGCGFSWCTRMPRLCCDVSLSSQPGRAASLLSLEHILQGTTGLLTWKTASMGYLSGSIWTDHSCSECVTVSERHESMQLQAQWDFWRGFTHVPTLTVLYTVFLRASIRHTRKGNLKIKSLYSIANQGFLFFLTVSSLLIPSRTRSYFKGYLGQTMEPLQAG